MLALIGWTILVAAAPRAADPPAHDRPAAHQMSRGW
jgi:hypothetical protein